jgi:hypothetical protein
MLSSKIILVILAVVGLGGLGIAAASGSNSTAKHVNDSPVQGSQNTTIQNAGLVPEIPPMLISMPITSEIVVTGDQGIAVHPEVSKTVELGKTGAGEKGIAVQPVVSKTVELDKTGADKKDIEVFSEVRETISSTESIAMPNRPASEIALKFGVPVTDIIKLHDTGWGFGNIVKLYELAKLTGKNPTEILAMLNTDEGRGQIEKALGVKHGNEGDNLGAIMSGRDTTDKESSKKGNSGEGQSENNSDHDKNKKP